MTNDPDHGRGTQDHPDAGGDAALEQANEASRRGNQAWMGRVAETMHRLSTDPELLALVERRGF